MLSEVSHRLRSARVVRQRRRGGPSPSTSAQTLGSSIPPYGILPRTCCLTRANAEAAMARHVPRPPVNWTAETVLGNRQLHHHLPNPRTCCGSGSHMQSQSPMHPVRTWVGVAGGKHPGDKLMYKVKDDVAPSCPKRSQSCDTHSVSRKYLKPSAAAPSPPPPSW